MFTENYVKYRKGQFLTSSCTLKTWGNTSGTFRFMDTGYMNCDLGEVMSRGKCGTIEVISSGSQIPRNYSGIYFGTGSTPAAVTDYKLENLISSGLTITNGNVAVTDLGNGKYEVSNDYIVKNTSGAEISIYEIGAVIESTKLYSGYDYYVYPCLVERTVLTEPITIAPGQAKLITYKVTFNQTLDVE